LLEALHYFFREEDVLGNGAIFKSVTRRDVEGLPIVWPGDMLAARFSDLVDPVWSTLHVLTKQTNNLRLTRDLLLPRLISGEVDVSELNIARPEVAA
jgi:type I restriction enzyme S subunit